MALPVPEYPLENTCSTIFNNTLYTYSAAAFQSLPLQKGSQWTILPTAVPVQGGVCVKSTPKNDTQAAALYIVGGTSNSSDYPGLQRYNFAGGKWETVRPTVPVTQNRLYHGAVYLNKTDSILVYAGTQDGSMQASSQTFTIQASEPYTVLAYEAIAPPAIHPLLMQYSESKAIYVGGSNTNKKAMVFSPSSSWSDSNATLANPIYNSTNVKSVIINGDDGSKTLYTFDMTVSPNVVNRTVLVDGEGNPVQNALPVVETTRRWLESEEESLGNLEDRALEERIKTKSLTVAEWPAYNGSFVPWTTRTSYSIAHDQSGLVVVSGGNREDVLCLFKARDNCWANATSVFVSKAQVQAPLAPSPTATHTADSGTSSAQTSSVAVATSASNSSSSAKLLGAIIGSVVGAVLIAAAVLLLLRRRRRRKRYVDAGHQRRSSGIPGEKDMDFQDRGLPQMSSTRSYRNHEPSPSEGSFSSVAILMGRVGHKRSGDQDGSIGSRVSDSFAKKFKTAISRPIPNEANFNDMANSPAVEKTPSASAGSSQARPRTNTKSGRRGSTRRSSGWNRYWSGGSALNILGFGSNGHRNSNSNAKHTTYNSEHGSEISINSTRNPSQITQVSALVPPLKLTQNQNQPQPSYPRPGLSTVPSGSPRLATSASQYPITGPMAGQIERHASVSTLSSYADDDRRDAFSSGVPASVHERFEPRYEATTWTPVEHWTGRAPSPAYTASVYGEGTTMENPFPFARQPPSQPPTQKLPLRPGAAEDMSWLNLGGGRRL